MNEAAALATTAPGEAMLEDSEAQALFRVAVEHYQQGRLADAEQLFYQLNEHSEIVSASVNLGAIQEGRGAFEAAIATYVSASRRYPGEPRILRRLAYLILREGQFEAGWKLHELRESKDAAVAPLRSLPYGEWDGKPVRRLLIAPEQGFGDQIMLARYFSELSARGLEPVVVTPPPLKRLFERFGVEIIEAGGRTSVPVCDAWVSIASLPLRMGVTATSIRGDAYLGHATGGAGLGVVTAGNPAHLNDKNRSLPLSLANRLRSLPGAVRLEPDATGALDFEDTARLVAGLDLVICVDTAVAHLAGALGKPCWVLLPYVADWRWFRDLADSPWYGSVRLFRQKRIGDWDGVLDEVERALAERREVNS